MEEFIEYLTHKKVDWKKFSESDPNQFGHFAELFQQMSPKSFTDQKLFLINSIRRAFPLEISDSNEKPKAVKKLKPKINPRIKK